ncbi:hypothetical protein [Pedobacter sp. V48]|uniref:hypothetical protein n=1 Tax=Pedobacter sp. V48 TaxID=509635 RepID=UPI0003E44CA1|nr:hypothetical protein [Pedobacter sp. V48]ETZ23023.1 hypothetical protein N824_20520 [Pedobacter sp. V48]
MKTVHPLLIYRDWFAELNLHLADDIAQTLLQAIIQCKASHKLQIKKESSQYPGLAAMALLNILDRQLTERGKPLNQQFAMTLLEVTRTTLKTDGRQTPALLEECKEQYVRNIALGNQDETSYFEQLVTQVSLEIDQKQAWTKLEASGFNFGAIQTYING